MTLMYPCRHCGWQVDLNARLMGWSDIAKVGALTMAQMAGVLCDTCYEQQERVR